MYEFAVLITEPSGTVNYQVILTPLPFKIGLYKLTYVGPAIIGIDTQEPLLPSGLFEI